MTERERQILIGWARIAEYVGVSVQTAKRWEEKHELPVHHDPVRAVKDELTRWAKKQRRAK